MSPVSSNVLVVEDGVAGSLEFSCSASSGLAQSIKIDCGNGQVIEDSAVSELTATCDYQGSGSEKIYSVVCSVNDSTGDQCVQSAIITPPVL
ncbi:MAG: hypothetical protein GXP45_03580 [bacterium]|nr:hypothetical protein [bacterium]